MGVVFQSTSHLQYKELLCNIKGISLMRCKFLQPQVNIAGMTCSLAVISMERNGTKCIKWLVKNNIVINLLQLEMSFSVELKLEYSQFAHFSSRTSSDSKSAVHICFQ